MFKMVDVVFNKNGIIVFIGLFGCGKLIGGGGYIFNMERIV